MADVTLLGSQPENEQGRRFETDAQTWKLLARLLVIAGFGSGLRGETAAAFLCAREGAPCSADEASTLKSRLELPVKTLVEGEQVADAALGPPRGDPWSKEKVADLTCPCCEYDEEENVLDPLGSFRIDVSTETVIEFVRFLQGSHGFVIRSQTESPD